MLDDDNEVKVSALNVIEMQLIDFGSSAVLESDDDLVRGTIGTSAFLAPECVQGTGEPYSGKVGIIKIPLLSFPRKPTFGHWV